MTPGQTTDVEEIVDVPLRLAEPSDVDPRETPYFSLWRRTDDDPEPLDSPVLEAYDRFVEEVDGFEDGFWTLLHWACGEAPTSSVVPAPPGKTRRVYVWRDDELLAMTADPAVGIRPQFPPSMDADQRVRYLSWFVRAIRRLKRTEVGQAFDEPMTDYRTEAAWDELRQRLEGADEDLGAVALFFTTEPTERS